VQPTTAPTPKLEPPARGRYDKWFQAYTLIHFQQLLSPRWPKGVAIAESALNFRATSPVGAMGLMQFMPATWTWIAPEPWRSRGAMDPEAAIWVGCYYLRWNWDRLPTPVDLHHKAMVNAAYNSGIGNVIKARTKCGGKPGCDPTVWDGNVELSLITKAAAQDETINYVRRIRKFENQLLIAGNFL
jgi:soluble lytic murein transglycosylase-like protein